MAWSRRPPSPPEENALELELQVPASVAQGDQPVVAEEVELSLLAAPRSPRRTASRTWKRRGALALAHHVTSPRTPSRLLRRRPDSKLDRYLQAFESGAMAQDAYPRESPP